jgi:hypothetical protein
MANTAKVFTDGDGYLFETNGGNFTLTNTELKHTTRTGNDLTEAVWDSTVDGMLQNAIAAMSELASVDTAKMLRVLVQEKMEDFDGPEA